MHSIESGHYRSPVLLLGIFASYAFINLIAGSLAWYGIIHPPGGIFVFFTFLGPALLAFGLLNFQIISRRRFSWIAAAAFLLAIGIAALINFHICALALSAV